MSALGSTSPRQAFLSKLGSPSSEGVAIKSLLSAAGSEACKTCSPVRPWDSMSRQFDNIITSARKRRRTCSMPASVVIGDDGSVTTSWSVTTSPPKTKVSCSKQAKVKLDEESEDAPISRKRKSSFVDEEEDDEELESTPPLQVKEKVQPSPSKPDYALGYAMLKDAVTSGAFQAHSTEYTKYSKLRGTIICVEGIISAGKTTLGKNIANYLEQIGIKAVFFQEFVEESLLKLFYSDPAKYAFSFQMFMLRSCMANLTQAEQLARQDGTVCVVDRSIWGNCVFAALQRELGNMTEEEWSVYVRVMKTKCPVTADHVVYLDCNPVISLERIKSRGRQSESTVPLDYLQNLERHYCTEMLLHLKERSANIVPILWDNFGGVPSVLDSLLAGRQYRVEGDPFKAFSKERSFRASVMSKLVAEGSVNIDSVL